MASLQEGIWGGTQEKDGERVLVTTRVLPGYLTCARDGRLPGCLFQFDDVDSQCSSGRIGKCSILCIAITSLIMKTRSLMWNM